MEGVLKVGKYLKTIREPGMMREEVTRILTIKPAVYTLRRSTQKILLIPKKVGI